jgi:hypothetical protein
VISAESIDGKQTNTYDRGGEGKNLYQDVIETPGKAIPLQQGTSFTFGTIEDELNLGPLAWPNGTHALAVRRHHPPGLEGQPRALREV